MKRELDPDDRIYLGAWTRLVIREATEDEIASSGLGPVWHGGGRNSDIRRGSSVDIKVGVKHVNREIVVESNQSAAEVEKAFADRSRQAAC